MRKSGLMFILMLPLLFLSPLCFAKHPGGGMLNRVMYPISVEGWVSTTTAKVVININATLKESDLAKARQDILSNMQKIAEADWHITQFNRSKGSSGLERLNVQATARLPNKQLDGLRKKAKEVSKPGASYKVLTIDFTPSLVDVEQARAKLREKVYAQANSELVQLKKAYPNEHYFIHKISFIGPAMHMKMEGARPRMMQAMVIPAAQVAMTVSNHVKVYAFVVLANDVKQAS